MKYIGIESVDARIERKIESAKSRKYFVPRELSECNTLIPQLQTIVNEHKSALIPWKKNACPWRMAKYAIGNPAHEAVWGKATRTSGGVVHSEAWRAAHDAAWDSIKKRRSETESWADVETDVQAAEDVAADVAWEAVRDMAGFEKNPFEQLVRIYDMGLIPRDFKNIDNAEKFVVDFPLTEKYYLGCWAEGDSEILYGHHYVELDYKDDYRSYAIVHHRERLRRMRH